MKRTLLLALFISILTGCASAERYEEDYYLALDESEYLSLIDDLYDDFKDPYITCAEMGIDPNWRIDGTPGWRFTNFDEMKNYEYSDFVYGKVIVQKDINCYSKQYYVEVLESGLTDDRQIIRISMEHDDDMTIGGLYVINIVYSEVADEYYLSQPNAVFSVFDETLNVPEMFKDELKDKTNISDFLNYVLHDIGVLED